MPASAHHARHEAPLRALACLVGGALAFIVGCQPPAAPQAPLTGSRALCCKQVDEATSDLRGCRESPRCRVSEPIWIRGPVECTPVSDDCDGGRCCALALPEPDEGAP